jgi:hypothetical protein
MIWPFRNRFETPWKRIEWDDSFQLLIQTKDEFELCNRVFLIVQLERSDAAFNEKDADLCLLLVWGAYGILDNGGFQYLFEGDYKPTDPDLRNTRRAFEIVGLPKVVEAFDVAFSAFPESTPPSDPKQRLKTWKAADEELRGRADAAWSRNSEIVPAVAAFIRRRKKELLQRYGIVREWPQNPYSHPPLDYSSIEACGESMKASGYLSSPLARFNVRSSCERSAWYQELNAARRKHGLEFGPNHPEYPAWEKWYLKNRKRLVDESPVSRLVRRFPMR